MSIRARNENKPSGTVWDVFARTRDETALHQVGDVIAPNEGLAQPGAAAAADPEALRKEVEARIESFNARVTLWAYELPSYKVESLTKRMEDLLAPLWTSGLRQHLPAEMPDEDLINALAQYLEFEPIEKLALLQQPGAAARCKSMIELLEMKAMTSDAGADGTVH